MEIVCNKIYFGDEESEFVSWAFDAVRGGKSNLERKKRFSYLLLLSTSTVTLLLINQLKIGPSKKNEL